MPRRSSCAGGDGEPRVSVSGHGRRVVVAMRPRRSSQLSLPHRIGSPSTTADTGTGPSASDDPLPREWRFTWNGGHQTSPIISPCAQADRQVSAEAMASRPPPPERVLSNDSEATPQTSVSDEETENQSILSGTTVIRQMSSSASTIPIEALPGPSVETAGWAGSGWPQSISPPQFARIANPVRRHHALLELMLEICTNAACHCWLTEASAYVPGARYILRRRGGGGAGAGSGYANVSKSCRHRPHPYGLIGPEASVRRPRREFMMVHSFKTHHRVELLKYVFRIANALWTRATRQLSSPSTTGLPGSQVETEALGRMQSLYHLSNQVVDAFELINQGGWLPYRNRSSIGLIRIPDVDEAGEVVVAETIDVAAVVMAARNLCILCTYEEGVIAIDEAWATFLQGESVTS